MAEGGVDLPSIYGLLVQGVKTVSRHNSILRWDLKGRVCRIENHLDLPAHISR